jgi:hypothetical protein
MEIKCKSKNDFKESVSVLIPGCIGRNEGRIQNSGGIGLFPDQSNKPSICKTLITYNKIHMFYIIMQRQSFDQNRKYNLVSN